MREAGTSGRARRWGDREQFLVQAHFACASDPFSTDANPRGYVNFGTAENHTVYDAARPLLQEGAELVEADAHYNALHGAAYLREAIADFLGARAGRPISADDLVLASGASAVLEILSFALCDPGDEILIPAPYYTGFDHDLGLRSEAELAPVRLAGPEFGLDLEQLELELAERRRVGRRVAAILLNSPQNPLGQIYDEALIRGAAALAEREGLHLILDEIYAESLLPGATHFSGLSLESPSVHVVYGFAKDFGLSGYKAGILWSANREVIEAAQGLAYFHTVSLPAQRLLAGMLRSAALPGFLVTVRERLELSHAAAVAGLAAAGIPVVEAAGGIVLWLDLRDRLTEPTFRAERSLWERIFTEAKVSVSPGAAFHCAEPGWFRLCHTLPPAQLREGLRRLGNLLA